MRLHEILEESLIDTIKKKLGEYKGKIFATMTGLLLRFKKHPSERLTTIETFKVNDISKDYAARVDTGAAICSLDAQDINVDFKYVEFHHAGSRLKIPLERMRKTKSASGETNRPIVKLSYSWNGKTYSNIDTGLIDRSRLKFKLLVGRNLISELKLPVHVADNDEIE